ncbi:MAG: hypothetical protein SNJ75_09620 [Gemmataceae bacterium]
MRYRCTLFTQSFDAQRVAVVGSEPCQSEPVAAITVRGRCLRQAAARAYVVAVGRHRATLLVQQGHPRPEIAALEASPHAVAAGLRRTLSRWGEMYVLDNANEAWFIKVEPLASPLPQRSTRHRFRSAQSPSPN